MADPTAPTRPRWRVVGRTPDGEFEVAEFFSSRSDTDSAHARLTDTEPAGPTRVTSQNFAHWVAELERLESPRWVWHDTASIYPLLLEQGVRVERCHDLRLCHEILRRSEHVTERQQIRSSDGLIRRDPTALPAPQMHAPQETALFDLANVEREHAPALSVTDLLTELKSQRSAVTTSRYPGRLAMLLAAESAGALIAAELTAAGLPWDTAGHNHILTETLGQRPASPLEKPAKLAAAGERVREALGVASLAIDSPPKLLQALRAAGVDVSSTSKWELAEHTHPAIEPLLHYKKLSRLMSANGWAWIDEWVQDNRYRPVYIPGGVVTGRWASNGGGALQLPRALRPAIRADDGWVFVSADVSQLEPRVLAAMSGDAAMAAAGLGRDLYAGIVESGEIASRDDAKIAMLGAMYGATQGESGRLVPKLRRVFPAAMQMVDHAASIGEKGGVVSTWLGRSSPDPEAEWHDLQATASLPGATQRDEALARRTARERGRFTRNFIVQGTAAEWALAWLAEIRRRLSSFSPLIDGPFANASGPAFLRTPHLAFFLHDEVIVHAPEVHADAVARAIEESASAAAALVFPGAPVDFRLDVTTSKRATKA